MPGSKENRHKMMRALSTAGTGMVCQQLNLDTIANNLANVNTNAFKGQRAEFQDLMYESYRASGAQGAGSTRQPIAVQVGLGSKFAATASLLGQGTLQPTGGTYDLAIQGEGYFQIEKPNGQIAYTRDGSFSLDADGNVVTSNGYKLSPAINVPRGATAVSISPSGVVSALLPGNNETQPVSEIKLAVFPNPGGLTRVGENLYEAGGGSGTATEVTPGDEGSGTLAQGFVEGSNVQIVEEMVKMILAQRAYEINSKAVQTSDEMLGILNNLKR